MAWVGDKKIGRNLDGRYSLTPEQEEVLMAEIREGVLKDGELGLKYGVSRSKVYFMRRPKQKDKKMADARKYQREHYDKDVRNEANKKLLLKKKALKKQGLL